MIFKLSCAAVFALFCPVGVWGCSANGDQSVAHGGGNGGSGGITSSNGGVTTLGSSGALGAGGNTSTYQAGAPSIGGMSAGGGAGAVAAAGIGGVAALGGAGGTTATAGAGAGGADTAAGGGAGCGSVFCEDFEEGALDATVWTVLTDNPANSVKLQTTTVKHGKSAAQFHVGGGKLDYLMMNHVPAALSSHFFGRANFNIGSGVMGAGHQMFTIAGAQTPGAGFPHSPRVEVGASGGKWQLTAWANETGGGEDYGSGGTLVTGKWACIEWEVQAGATNVITVWVDGVMQLTKNAKGLVSAFSQLGFGYYAYSNPPAFDIYLDDIELDTARVNCLL